MEEPDAQAALREFLPLTDSLTSRIRWRACDYAALFAAELELILRGGEEPESGPLAHELRSGIRVLAHAEWTAGTEKPDASYMTGQVLHPNGGDFIPS